MLYSVPYLASMSWVTMDRAQRQSMPVQRWWQVPTRRPRARLILTRATRSSMDDGGELNRLIGSLIKGLSLITISLNSGSSARA